MVSRAPINRTRIAVQRRRERIVVLAVIAVVVMIVIPSYYRSSSTIAGKAALVTVPSSQATGASNSDGILQHIINKVKDEEMKQKVAAILDNDIKSLGSAIGKGNDPRKPDPSQPLSPNTGAGVKHPNFPNGAPIPTPYHLDPTRFSARQKRVVEGIRHAFVNYKKYAWGHDELRPLGKHYSDWGNGGNTGIGLTAIEMLDTMWLVGLYDEFHEVVEWLKTPAHTFQKEIEVGLFETTIRVLGGLLSSYELSGEPILLDKAYDIGNRLFKCIEGHTIPDSTLMLSSGHVFNPGWLGYRQSLAEVTTIQLEFKKLSQYTGEMKYDKEVTRVMKQILQHTPRHGLFPIYISLGDGTPAEGQVTLGARGDSFYEYLAKQWQLTNYTEDWLRTAYERVADGVITKLVVKMDETHSFVAEAHNTEGNSLEHKMDHLVCFVVGMLQIGKHGSTAARDDKAAGDIARTCYEMYHRNPTGLGTEIVRFRTGADGKYEMYPSPGAYHYIMRPEVMEAMFYQSRFHPEEYDEWSNLAWTMYESMEKHLKVENGWVGLSDATNLNSGKNDKMESFFCAETLKYAFLCAANKEVAPTQLPLADWVFNTEAHPLKVLSGPLKY